MKKTLAILLPLGFAALLLLNSCLGVSADISIRKDGSGRIALEYRVSQVLESMGRLDGNARRPAIPVGRADFERSLARIPGLRLVSHKTKDVPNAAGGRDLRTTAVLEFRDTAALLAFLDSSGGGATLTQKDGKNLLRLVFRDSSAAIDNADLKSLLKEISAGYGINVSLRAPAGARITTFPPSVPAATIVSGGKKVSFSIGVADFIDLDDGLTLEIAW